ncbi:MAG: Phosphatidate cytidylyltransferase [uncultured Acidimicrobiales bacterium]|uniref:Phosphatidate cytidylyltransferase n=1 Tax=uncultured Acidimicrobiales bacterium TaxID=310071 RepID=A0A6J4IVY7_9ACTN|nr:MAG: Phosphatidate cytidylyltransferase [uncultured Acidimicrobiales bacterium]
MADRDDEFDDDGVRLLPGAPGLNDDDPASRSSVWAAAVGEELDDLDDDPWSPPTGGVTSLAGGDHLDVGTASGPVEMQDWTEPPTGNVPRVILGADDDWSTRTGSQPRWRGGQDDWTENDFDNGLLGDERIGALDETRDDRPDMYSFEEDLPSQPQAVVQLPSSGATSAGPPGAPTELTPPGAEELAPTSTVAPIRTRARPDEAPFPDPAGPGRNLPMATMVGGGLAFVAGFLFLVGKNIGPWLLATGVVMVCAYELFDAFQRSGLRPATLLGLTSCFALMWGAYARGLPAINLVLFLSFVGSMLWYLLKVIQARALLGVATTMLGIVWVGLLGSFAALMLVGGPNGRMLLLGAILCAVASDIGGLAVGTLAGRSQLAPDISPNKTVEGTLGGLALCVLVGLIFCRTSGVWDNSLANGLLLGLVVGVVAAIGDLSQSLIKRDLGLKDMGTALPGHGGFLDRFDSLLFALPATYFLALSIL